MQGVSSVRDVDDTHTQNIALAGEEWRGVLASSLYFR